LKSLITKLGAVLLVATVLLGLLASCTTPEKTTESTTPLQITDQADRTVTLKTTDPQKIISLSPSNTEILFALGLGDRVVGVTQWCNYPAEAQDKTKIGGFSPTDIDVGIEQIVDIGPDLILATETHLTEVVPKLEEFVPEATILVLLTQTESFDVIFEAINLVGQCTGTGETAAQLVADMSDRIKATTDITDNLTDAERPSVFYIVWHDPIFAIGGGTLGNTLIEAAGGINIFRDTTGSPIVDLEAIIDRNPEVILGSSAVGAGADLPYQFALTDERLSGVDARLNNRVYGANDDIYGRPGPRLVEALEELAKLLHPELFP
jgi:iron complex transport system substrate-binding protein